MSETIHKPGWTKQQNKPHKSRFRTKGQIEKLQKPKRDNSKATNNNPNNASASATKQAR